MERARKLRAHYLLAVGLVAAFGPGLAARADTCRWTYCRRPHNKAVYYSETYGYHPTAWRPFPVPTAPAPGEIIVAPGAVAEPAVDIGPAPRVLTPSTQSSSPPPAAAAPNR